MPPNGGFDYVAYNKALARIQLPDKIKCKICKKIRGQNVFSKRQLEDLRKAMLRTGTTGMNGPGYATCRTCVGGQTVELTCCMCDQTKGLDGFSKAQRKDPDNARCLNCVQLHLDTDPVAETPEDADDQDSFYETSATRSRNDYLTNSLGNLSITDGSRVPTGSLVSLDAETVRNENTRPGGEDEGEEQEDKGGVWLGQDDADTATAKQGGGIKFTGYDTQGKAHSRVASPPSVAPSAAPTVHSAWGQWGITESNRASSVQFTSPPKSKGNSKFAKPVGPRIPKGQGPKMGNPETDTGTITIQSDDEEDSDDDIQNYL